MRVRYIEIAVGAFMLAGLMAFIVLTFKVSGLSHMIIMKTYAVTADFENIGDLKIRAPVTLAGVRIGEVEKITLDSKSLLAHVKIQLEAQHNEIPENTSARILTQGILGSSYIGLTPGLGEEAEDGVNAKKDKPRYLRHGSVIADTQPALILENLIGQFIFNTKKD